MARFFGTVQGGRGKATRLGHSDLDVTAQSFSGSIIVHMFRDSDDVDCVSIRIGIGSTGNGVYDLYRGSIKELFSDQNNFGR